MADRITKKVQELAAASAVASTPEASGVVNKPTRSLAIAQAGLHTGFDMINLLTATITDTLEERITTTQAHVVVGASRNILKVVELQQRYGRPKTDGRERDLVLIGVANDDPNV